MWLWVMGDLTKVGGRKVVQLSLCTEGWDRVVRGAFTCTTVKKQSKRVYQD